MSTDRPIVHHGEIEDPNFVPLIHFFIQKERGGELIASCRQDVCCPDLKNKISKKKRETKTLFELRFLRGTGDGRGKTCRKTVTMPAGCEAGSAEAQVRAKPAVTFYPDSGDSCLHVLG